MIGRSRLTAYVYRDLVLPTLLGVFLWAFVLLMNQMFFIAREAIAKNLPWATTLEMIALYLPEGLVLAIPMGTLFGTMIGIGRLSGDHETVALQGTGLGPGFLLSAALVHGALATITSFVVYSVIQPEAKYARRALQNEILTSTSLATNLKPRVFYTDLPGAVLYVSEIPAGNPEDLRGILLYRDAAEAGSEEIILARRASLSGPSPEDGSLGLLLEDGVIHIYRSQEPDGYQFGRRFGRYYLAFQPPEFIRAIDRSPTRLPVDMPLGELRNELREAAREKIDILREHRVRRASIEIQQRLALPLSCLLFAVLAVPLGMTYARSGKGASFAMSMAVLLIYWVVFKTLRDQASQGRFPAFLGVWGANLVMMGWAITAYRPLRHPHEPRSRIADALHLATATLRRQLSRITPGSRSTPTAGEGPERNGNTNGSAGQTASASRWVGLIDRYVGVLYLRVFSLALLAAYLIYVLAEMQEILGGVLEQDGSLFLFLRYFKYFLPGKLDYVMPIACLIGAVVAFTLLARHGELTAIKAGGLSLQRTTLPVLVVTFGLCGLLYLVQDRIAPVTNRKAQEVKDQIYRRTPRTYGMPAGGRWTFGEEGNRLYHYRFYDAARTTFQGLSVFTLDLKAPRIVDHRFGTSARWDGRTWHVEKAWYRTFPADGSVGVYERVGGSQEVMLDPPENFARRESGWASGGGIPEQMSLPELTRQIEALQHSGYDTTRLVVAYWSKLAQPFTPFVMTLLGLPFAFQVGRRGSLYGVGVALVLVIVYWATFAVFNALGLETILNPFLAAWAPNILYGMLGVYLLLYVRT